MTQSASTKNSLQRRKRASFLSQDEREGESESCRSDDGSSAGDHPERGRGWRVGRGGLGQGPRRRLGRRRGREGGEVVGGGRQVGAVGRGHVDPQLLALPAVARSAAGEVGAAERGEVEDGVAVVELEHGLRQLAGRERLRRHLQHRVLARRVQEPDGVAELEVDGLGPARVDVGLGGRRDAPGVEVPHLVHGAAAAVHQEQQHRCRADR
uniref:Uncharacterized protein n=1 Tax=Arundo donax TaxID=35708 RepID=A0A0A9CR56_ARUDO